jgi:hypothetical protein
MMKLNEENMQLEGRVRIMGVENDTLKQSFVKGNSGVWENEPDLVNNKKSSTFGNKEDLKRSSSYTNVLTSNIRSTGNSRAAPEFTMENMGSQLRGNTSGFSSGSPSSSGFNPKLPPNPLPSNPNPNFNFAPNPPTAPNSNSYSTYNFEFNKKTVGHQSPPPTQNPQMQFRRTNGRDY